MSRCLHFLLFLLLFLILKTGYAQLGLESSFLSPAGDFSYVKKPTVAFTLTLKGGSIDDRYRCGFSIGYCNFKSTQDTIPTTTIQTGGLGNFVLPGYFVYQSYQVASFSFTNDFKILKDANFSPTVGLDLVFYGIAYSDTYYTETLVQASETGNTDWSAGILPQVGIQYVYSSWFLLTANIGRNLSFGSAAPMGFWKTSIGIAYYLR